MLNKITRNVISGLSPTNDTYADILNKYSILYKDDAKNKLASEIKAEFQILRKKALQLASSMNIFSDARYEHSIQAIIAIDREMSRKIAGLKKINISLF
jgi:hypothetical protein